MLHQYSPLFASKLRYLVHFVVFSDLYCKELRPDQHFDRPIIMNLPFYVVRSNEQNGLCCCFVSLNCLHDQSNKGERFFELKCIIYSRSDRSSKELTVMFDLRETEFSSQNNKYFFFKILFSAHLEDASLTSINKSVNLKVYLHCAFLSTILRQYCICFRMGATPLFAIVCVICLCNYKPGYSEDICFRSNTSD